MTRPSDSGASGVDWGAPIPVDGKRPEWLASGEGNGGQVDYDGHWCRQRGTYGQWCWEGVTAIRLPADHPHYRQPQPADTVTVGRGTRAAWREWANERRFSVNETYNILEALGLIKPDPIDPDLIEARTICSKEASRLGDSGLAIEYLAGDCDDQTEMKVALAAIKRGRALATAEKALAWGEGE